MGLLWDSVRVSESHKLLETISKLPRPSSSIFQTSLAAWQASSGWIRTATLKDPWDYIGPKWVILIAHLTNSTVIPPVKATPPPFVMQYCISTGSGDRTL